MTLEEEEIGEAGFPLMSHWFRPSGQGRRQNKDPETTVWGGLSWSLSLEDPATTAGRALLGLVPGKLPAAGF